MATFWQHILFEGTQSGLAADPAMPRPFMGLDRVLIELRSQPRLDQTTLALQDDLSERIAATVAHGVLIDISALDIVHSFVGRILASISGIAAIMGATLVVVGMQPAVAITLVELGLSLDGVRTALDVERGMALLQADERSRSGN